MRTTVNLADDVLYAVKDRARRERRSMGDVLSELARDALTGNVSVDAVDTPQNLHGFDPLPHRGGAVSNTLIDRLREEEFDEVDEGETV